MERLLGGERKDLVLLTATPINNGLWDLYNLVMVFARHDRAFAADRDPVGPRAVPRGRRERARPREPRSRPAVPARRRGQRPARPAFHRGALSRAPRFPTARRCASRSRISDRALRPRRRAPGLVQRRSPDEIGALDDGAVPAERIRARRPRRPRPRHSSAGCSNRGSSSASSRAGQPAWRRSTRMITAHEAFLAAWDDGRRAVARGRSRAAALRRSTRPGLAAWVEEQLEEDADARPVAEFQPEYREAVAADRERLERDPGAAGRARRRLRPEARAAARAARDLARAEGRGVRDLRRHGRVPGRALPATIGGRERVGGHRRRDRSRPADAACSPASRRDTVVATGLRAARR